MGVAPPKTSEVLETLAEYQGNGLVCGVPSITWLNMKNLLPTGCGKRPHSTCPSMNNTLAPPGACVENALGSTLPPSVVSTVSYIHGDIGLGLGPAGGVY